MGSAAVELPEGTVELPAKEIVAKLSDWKWRINNLYKIVDQESGEITTFKMNWAQLEVFEGMHHRNIILKARQLGMTTFVMIFMLDQCLFNAGTRCQVIAHGLTEASDLFENKILFAYDRLPEWLKAIKPTKRRTGKTIRFTNDSYIRVGVSARSGTLDYLHISEFGKVCVKYPDRAKEIITGSFPAAQNGTIFIESTAEGQEGYFADYVERARTLHDSAIKLTSKDFRFMFFPWWKHPGYRLSKEETKLVSIPQRLQEYFLDLEEDFGIETDEQQQAWYVKEEEILGNDMKREHPSTPAEAFEVKIEGAYFHDQIRQVCKDGRVGSYPHQSGIPVDTWWDLGMSDSMAIWMSQTVGGRVMLINYYENSGEGMMHYIKHLQALREKKGYMFGRHYGPHDLQVRELFSDGKSRVDKAREYGFKFEVVPRVPDKQDAIDAARDAFSICHFDDTHCGEALDNKLKKYRKEWDSKRGVWRDKPFHGPESNCADAFQTMAMGHPLFRKGRGVARAVQKTRRTR